MTNTPLPADADSLRRVMAIYAHPDDPEFFSGGTLAKWALEGKELVYVLATSGDKGTDDQDMTAQRLIEIREAEQRAAAILTGGNTSQVIFLRYGDGELEPNLDLRRALTRIIRIQKPDIVVTNDPATRWFDSGSVNHPDHRVIGDATLNAVYPSARDRHTFVELWRDEKLEPHKVRHIYLAGTRDGNEKVNITDVLDRKIAAICEHKSQVKDPEALAKRQRDGFDPAFAPEKVYTESFRVLTLR
ncbi:MAG TPA: PIG-L deacetylase family protein [Aggregatilineales bacterium]|nr:PIG-L deacetylase family protein [Aggregatilineales bacterium]